MRKNRTSSYYFSGTPSILGSYFQVRSTEYNRYIRDAKANKVEDTTVNAK